MDNGIAFVFGLLLGSIISPIVILVLAIDDGEYEIRKKEHE